jgi:hypothetical protein
MIRNMGRNMSTKARQYAATSANKGHAKAEARKRARQQYARRRGLPWFKIGVGAFAVLLVGLLALNFATTARGTLSAQSTSFAFGDVPWRGGLVTTQFPLTVEGDATVVDIVST